MAACQEHGRPALLAKDDGELLDEVHPTVGAGILFPSARVADDEPRPVTANAVSLMLTHRYHAGGGPLRSFGSHRIRHGSATMLANNGMLLEEVSRYLVAFLDDADPAVRAADPDSLGRRAS